MKTEKQAKTADGAARRRVVLVGTYKGDQLADWPGWYCWPLGKDDFNAETQRRGEKKQTDLLAPDDARGDVDRVSGEQTRVLESVTELWLFQGTKEQRNYKTEFVGVKTREELVRDYGYPATGNLEIHAVDSGALSVRFSRITTIGTDGAVVPGAPAALERPPAMTPQLAATLVAGAARAQGVQLTAEQTSRAVAFVAEFGDRMFETNRRLLARFIVSLKLDDENAEKDRRRLEFLAPQLAQWRDFGLAAPGREAVADFFKDECNAIILEFEKPNRKADEFVDDISHTMSVDIPRGVYTVGGKRFNHGTAADVIAELDKLNLAPAAKRTISILMSQTSAVHLMSLQIHNEQPPHALRANRLDPSTLPGAGTFVSRGNTSPELFMSPQIVGAPVSIFDLTVSEDGRTATLKIIKSERMRAGTPETMLTDFGSVVVEEELTIDIAAEVPAVTNVRVSQIIGADDNLGERYLEATKPREVPPPAP